jgi:hypothetical protein
MGNPNHNSSPPLDPTMVDVIATLERVRDEWTHVAMELRDFHSSLDSLERQAAIGKANALITRINRP